MLLPLRAPAIRLALLLVLLAATAILIPGTPASAGGGACWTIPTPREATGAQVIISHYCFTPLALHVTAGSEVTFINGDEAVHNVSSSAFELGNAEPLNSGERFSVPLPTPGLYPFACTLHPAMAGVVVVHEPGDIPASLPRADAAPAPAPMNVRSAPVSEPSSPQTSAPADATLDTPVNANDRSSLSSIPLLAGGTLVGAAGALLVGHLRRRTAR